MAIRSETRTTHVITIDLPDDVIGSMEMNDDIEVIFHSRVSGGRMPAPVRLSWAMKRWIFGTDR